MYLKNLEINGFKTFARPVKLDFEQGVSAIVGPNGSGKSNIIDAVRWVLGEQNVRILRGKRIEEMIFSGSKNQKTSGMAEVTAVFDNSDRFFPLEYEELSVKRKMFREGDSRYYINGHDCRLKDIQELFMGTGLGKSTISILSQMQADQVLSANPIDRREIVEEVAGISIYKFRRSESLRKLEKTEQNLIRLGDIKDEMQKNLEGLSKQLAKFEKYKKSKDESTVLNYLYLKKNINDIDFSISTLEKEKDVLLTNKNKETVNLKNHDLEFQRLEEKLEVLHNRQNELLKEISQTRSKLEKIKAQKNFFIEKEGFLKGQIEKFKKRYDFLSEEIIRKDTSIKEAEDGALELENKLKKIKDDIIINDNNLSSLHKEYNLKLAEILKSKGTALDNSQNDSHFLITDKIKEIEEKIKINDQNYYKTRESLKHNKERISELSIAAKACSQKKEDIIIEEEKIREELQILLKNLDLFKYEIEKIGSEKDDLKTYLSEVQVEYFSLTKELTEDQNIYHRLSSEISMIEKLEGEKHGISHHSKEVEAAKKNIPGLYGIISDHLQIRGGYEDIVLSFFSFLENDIWVENKDTFSNLISLLGDKAKSPSKYWLFKELNTFILDIEKKPSVISGDIISTVFEMVEINTQNEDFRNFIEFFLKNAFLVKDITTAYNLWNWLSAKGYSNYYILTQNGYCLSSEGYLLTGHSRPKEISSFSRRRILKEKREAVALIQKKQKLLSEKISNLKNEQNEITKKIEKIEKEFSQKKELATSSQNKIEYFNSKLELVDEKLQNNESENENIKRKIEDYNKDNLILEANLENIDKNLDGLNKLRAEMSNIRSMFFSVKERLLDEKSRLKISSAEYSNKLEYEKKDLESIKKININNKNELDLILLEIQNSENELKQLLKEKFEDADPLEKLQTDLSGKENGYTLAQSQISQLIEDKKNYNTKRNIISSVIEELEKKCHTLDLLIVELKTKREDRSNNFKNIDFITEDKIPSKLKAISSNMELMEKEIEKINKLIESFGSINLAAPQEYRTIEERYNKLLLQIEDLSNSSLTLKDTISKLDEKTMIDFKDAFDKINNQFNIVYKTLQKGGSADLKLTDPCDLLKSGVDIEVCPPGKKKQNLALLSSGERAITAIAFLLSSLKVKPSPFVILDELDAPLDDSNVERVSELLKEFSNNSQFIIVTHNRKTMEFASMLYGITMEDDGVSKVVSVNLKNIENDVLQNQGGIK